MQFLPSRLLRLRGVWLLLFRAVWCVAVAGVLLSAIGATWFETQSSAGGAPSIWASNEAAERLGVRIFPPSISRAWEIDKPYSQEALRNHVGYPQKHPF
jgi:hypothetical protein